MSNRHYLVDFTDDFKDGGYAEVEILAWQTVDGATKAIVDVIQCDNKYPRVGEIRRISLGSHFTSMSHEQWEKESPYWGITPESITSK